MQVNNLQGAQLDYWTARAEGIPAEQLTIRRVQRSTDTHCIYRWEPYRCFDTRVLRYSTDWAQGGPLIEKHEVTAGFERGKSWATADSMDSAWHESTGDTPLIAICRAVVRAAFGDEVEEVAVCE